MTTREKILELVADMEQTDNELTEKLLSLFSVSKRFNFPNFIAGIMTGILICTIIIELAF